MKLLPFIVSSLCIIFFFDDVIFAEKKYNRVRCRDLWCNYKSRKDKEDLIKEIKRLEDMNRFHQETNGELRQKISTVRELRKENSELRDKLKKPLVLTEDMEVK